LAGALAWRKRRWTGALLGAVIGFAAWLAGVDVGEGRDLKFLVTSTPGQTCRVLNRSGSPSSEE